MDLDLKDTLGMIPQVMVEVGSLWKIPLSGVAIKETTRDGPGGDWPGQGKVGEWERMVQWERQMEDTGRGRTWQYFPG